MTRLIYCCSSPEINTKIHDEILLNSLLLSVLILSCCSVAKSCPALCDPMNTKLPCPSLSPRACSDWSPLSCWCHLTIYWDHLSTTWFGFVFSSDWCCSGFMLLSVSMFTQDGGAWLYGRRPWTLLVSLLVSLQEDVGVILSLGS